MMEIQLFYLRFSCPSLSKAPPPPSLALRCFNASNGSSSSTIRASDPSNPLEKISRSRAFPSQASVSLTLRRDRMDAAAGEAIYVCTDMVHASDPFSFFICDDAQEEIFVSASIKRPCSYGAAAAMAKLSSHNWSLECTCVSSALASRPGSCNGRGTLGDGDGISSCLEICVAGRDSSSSSPVILSRTLQHVLTRKAATARHCRRNSCSNLEVIFENDEREDGDLEDADADDYCVLDYDLTEQASMADSSLLSSQVEEHMFYQTLDVTRPPPAFYQKEAYFGGDADGELTWFNTGVRVGVGIGLGMCVGIGVGVSLLMRGYVATAKTLKKRLL